MERSQVLTDDEKLDLAIKSAKTYGRKIGKNVLGEAWLAVSKYSERINPQLKPERYMQSCLRCHFLDFYRKERQLFSRMPRLADVRQGMPVGWDDEQLSYVEDPSADLQSQEFWEKALDGLTPYQQDLYLAYYVDGLNITEIGAECGVSKQAVHKVMAQVMTRVKRNLERWGYDRD